MTSPRSQHYGYEPGEEYEKRCSYYTSLGNAAHLKASKAMPEVPPAGRMGCFKRPRKDRPGTEFKYTS